MEKPLKKVLATLSLVFVLPYGSGAFAEDEEWTCPAKGAYSSQICQCLEARRPGGA